MRDLGFFVIKNFNSNNCKYLAKVFMIVDISQTHYYFNDLV